MINPLLHLPVERGHSLAYKPLSDAVHQELRAHLSNVVVLIIGEISMMSNITLVLIHLRVSEIVHTSDEVVR